jgi:DNA-binding LacI/PurR family transcriptional regulator
MTSTQRGLRAPRLVDISAAAGVHVSTVSRVLNGDPAQSIRPETYQRIMAVARQQGYRPNALARALKRRRTGAIAFVVPLLRNPSGPGCSGEPCSGPMNAATWS